ncbi:hypothetical protein PG984_009905 [Apiospora sp. TS-2023a]
MAMPEASFIQYTGEPEKLQSARIPRALWEEKRTQIISLFQSLTLNEVIETMKQDGFTANRRQYVYQLEQWGVKKYKTQSDKSSNADDASNNKRKHDTGDISPVSDDHQEAPESSSLQVTTSSKRPKVAVESEIGPDGDMLQTCAADNTERPAYATGANITTRASYGLPTFANRSSLTPGFLQSPAHQLWGLLYNSSPCWYAAKRNDEIAREVSRCTKAVRSQPEINFWEVFSSLLNLGNAEVPGYSSYLQDIGDYLCGIKKEDEAFDIYALVLGDPGSSYILGYDMNLDMKVMSCVRSAETLEACELVASYLQNCDILRWEDPSSLVIARLVLARKLARHGSYVDAEYQAHESLRLKELTCVDLGGKSTKKWSILNSVQDWYWLKVQKDCGRFSETSCISRAEDPWGECVWNYSRLAMDLSLLMSVLLGFSKIIREQWLDDNAGTTEGEETHENDKTPLSAIFFRILWHAQFEKSQIQWMTLTARVSRVVDVHWRRAFPLPDFVGTCCEILAKKAAGRQLPDIPRTLTAWRDCLRELDLGSLVSRMDTRELHSIFLECYCGRDAEFHSMELAELEDEGDYRPPADLMTHFNKWKLSELTEIGERHISKRYPETSGFLPTATARSTTTKPRASSEHLANNGAIDDTQSSYDMAISPSFQPRPVPRSNSSVEKYYLDPTLGSSCRSSLASYGRMIEARAAMARRQKQAENVGPTKGAGSSLPSAMLRMEELSVSMGSVSLQDL